MRPSDPNDSGTVAPVALPSRAEPPARPASEIAGTTPPAGRPDTDAGDATTTADKGRRPKKPRGR